jgi:hypothetical protein
MKSDLSKLPTVFIASPYTKGDPAVNTHFQCKIFDQLLTDRQVLPVAPLWTHFQHLLYPRPYKDWIDYDQAMLRLYDCCLRLDAEVSSAEKKYTYLETQSSGADAEVATFIKNGKPVFYSIADLYTWVSKRADSK